MVGYLAEIGIRNFYADIAFLGAAGIHDQKGITDYSFDQVGIKKVLLKQAKRKIVIADHTKFDKIQLAAVCPLSEIDSFISDDGLSQSLREKYSQLNLNIQLV